MQNFIILDSISCPEKNQEELKKTPNNLNKNLDQ